MGLGNAKPSWAGPAIGGAVEKNFTTTGSSVLIMSANNSRLGYLIQNPVSTDLNPSGNSIFVRLGAAATDDQGDSFEVTPGGYFPLPGLPLFRGDVYVIGPSGGSAVKCPAVEFTQ